MKKYLLSLLLIISFSYSDFLDPDGFCIKNVSVREDGKIYFEYSMESMSGMLLSRPFNQSYLDYVIAHSNFTNKTVTVGNIVMSDCVLNDSTNDYFLYSLVGILIGFTILFFSIFITIRIGSK